MPRSTLHYVPRGIRLVLFWQLYLEHKYNFSAFGFIKIKIERECHAITDVSGLFGHQHYKKDGNGGANIVE